MYQRIMVAVDGSGPSSEALEEGIKFARDQGAQLRLVHVLDFASSNWAAEGYVDLSLLQQAIRNTGTQILAQAARHAEDAGVAVETALLEGYGERIPKMIAEAAREWPADLIVVGTHGRHGFDHLLLGSVAEGVVRTASVPVLLIRAS